MVGFSMGSHAASYPLTLPSSSILYHWDTAERTTIMGTNGQPVTSNGQEVVRVNSATTSATDAPLLRDPTLAAAPTYHVDSAGYPGVRTHGTSILCNPNTADWKWSDKLIGLVYSKHDAPNGVNLSRREISSQSPNNSAGGWMYGDYNAFWMLYPSWHPHITKKTNAGTTSITVTKLSIANNAIVMHLNESVQGQTPVITNYVTPLTGLASVPSDASTQFPMSLGGYYGINDSAVVDSAHPGRRFSDITVHELLVIDPTVDANVLSAILKRKWWQDTPIVFT
jgi:hypothetical protein